MIKRLVLLVLMPWAVISMGIAVFRTEESPAKARFERVQRKDVHQVVAVTGQLTYTDEEYIYAPVSGIVKRVCVKEKQRVEAGELLMCMESIQQDQLASAVYEGLPEHSVNEIGNETMIIQDQGVVRSKDTCTVRQVLVTENTPIAAGTPICRVTSNQQEIICLVTMRDANQIKEGMWAWLTAEGEPSGTAIVRKIGEEVADSTNGLRRVYVEIQPDEHIDLPEGTVVDVDIYLAGSDDVLSLPLEAITEQNTVWWVNEGRCTEIPAQIVLCDEMNAWVDLPEGLTVAVGEFTEGQAVVEAAE